ncbi:CAP and S-layer homology domain-containing protein [Solibacillus sp. FSL K6-1523]|uniref:CAP and S-layer homology domain-containing protein n=1 Tax=Solibacillus sp. FSL K6-1523 TaxID=2921471 RepID=UPI0030F6FCB3
MKKITISLIVIFTYNGFTLLTEAASYSDVSTKHPSYNAIQWADKYGIASGNNGQFNPASSVTEAQFAKMYVEFFQFPSVPNERTDSHVWSDIYYDRLNYYNAPVKGADNYSVREKSINRGTLAQLIAFAHGKPSDLNSAVTYLMAEGISSGQNMNESDPAKIFGASNSLTRSQAVTFLYRMSQNNQGTLAASVLSGTSNVAPTKPTTPLESLDASKLYDVGGNLSYYITNSNYKEFELAVLSGKDKIGGYITKKGAILEGFEVGKAYKGEAKVKKNGKLIYILVDKLNGNKIDAIYWENADEVSAKKFKMMKRDTSASKYSSLEFLFIEITNVTRANNEIHALKYDPKVAKLAKNHSTDMNTNNYFDHYSQSGVSPFDRMENAGLYFTTAGENLSYNYPTIFEAHNGLLNSQGHRDNINNKYFSYAGVGITGSYYTIKFITYPK